MRHKLIAVFDRAVFFLILATAAFTPLIFINKTTEFYEIPKLIFLISVSLLMFALWTVKWLLQGKITFTRTPFDVPLLFFAGVIIVSTFLSETRSSSIYGNLPRVHGSAVSWITYIIIYFVTVSHLKNIARLRLLFYALLAGGTAVSLITISSYFNIFLPLDFAKNVNFTPTGSTFSTIALLLLLIPIPVFVLIHPSKSIPVALAAPLVIIFGITVILTGSIESIIILFIALALSFLVTKPGQIKKTLLLFLAPAALLIAFLVITLFPGSPLASLQEKFPKEIQLPLSVSWKIAASALGDSPILGTGPSSYQFNFTSYKPVEFNSLRFWNFSFDTAYNEFLQVMSTLGFAGLIVLLLLCTFILNYSRRNLSSEPDDSRDHFLIPALAIAGIISVFLLAIHATTLVSIIATIFILAALMASRKQIREQVTELSLGFKVPITEHMKFDLLPLIAGILFTIGAVFIVLQLYNAVAADYYHREALSQASTNGSLTYNYLQKAETLNPNIDLYRVDMAQTNFVLANAIATQKGPTESNPEGSLTDQDKTTIQTLLSQAISEGKAAVAINPRSARNWEVLGSIYRNISGVAENSLAFALDAYGRAIQQDPLNPSLRLAVGGVYYSAKNYDLAVRFFSDAINLKPDYANAYYNLAIALRDKGDLQNAIAVSDRMMTLLSEDSQDYKTASDLLTDLKNRLESGNVTSVGQQAPAGQTGSALDNAGLDVNVNLSTPPQASTPSAVGTQNRNNQQIPNP